jgi:hypothetical protein
MTVAKRRQVSIPLWLMIALLITWGVGYLMLSSALTRLYAEDPPGFLSVLLTVLYEVAKTIIIGV